MTLGCRPSFKYRSACFMSSPMSSTVEVVPSLHPKNLNENLQHILLNEHCSCRNSPRDIILRNSSASDHHSSRILYLHLPQQHVAVLCELDICCRQHTVSLRLTHVYTIQVSQPSSVKLFPAPPYLQHRQPAS